MVGYRQLGLYSLATTASFGVFLIGGHSTIYVIDKMNQDMLYSNKYNRLAMAIFSVYMLGASSAAIVQILFNSGKV